MLGFCDSNAGCERKKLMKLKLIANDETLFEVDEDVAFQSEVIRDMFNVLHISDPKSEFLGEPIPIAHLDGRVMRKILDWCEAHRHEVYKEKEGLTILTDEDNEYLRVPNQDLFTLLRAANYLNIPGIVDIITKKIAETLHGMSVWQMRAFLGVENDFTPEEEREQREMLNFIMMLDQQEAQQQPVAEQQEAEQPVQNGAAV